MLDFIYWITGILLTIFLAYKGYKFMNRIENTKINQKADILKGVKGVDITLGDKEDLHIKDMDINQEAKQMNNVTGLSFDAQGKQSARLQGIKITQPGAEITISNDPSFKVEINKQG